MYCHQETLQIIRDRSLEGETMMCSATSNQRRMRVAVLMSDEMDSKTKIVFRDIEEHFVMIKGQSLEEIYQL